MIVIRTMKKNILQLLKDCLPAKEFAAILTLMALLMPIAAPIPAWAYSLNSRRIADDGLRLYSPESTSDNSLMGLLADPFPVIAAFFSFSKKTKAITGNSYSKGALEQKVRNFSTKLKDKTEFRVGEAISLAAQPVDGDGNIVNGLALRWKSSNTDIVKITNDSQATALTEGDAVLTVFSGKLQKQYHIKINANQPLATKNINNSALTPLFPTDPPQPINDDQFDSLFRPENNLGRPVGQTETTSSSPAAALRTTERAGSANFNFGITAASLPGRGLDASVGISYNSRVWNKTADGYEFNIDGSWLAPGFNIGYGHLDRYNHGVHNNRYSLVSSDGTRIQFSLKETISGKKIYQALDGSFIQLHVASANENTAATIEVIYTNGTRAVYGAPHGTTRRYPIGVTDRNGNMISIAYVGGDFPEKIAYIKDTLNRYITFNYDSTTEQKLVSITVPGYDNSSTSLQTIRFYYESLTLQWQDRFNSSSVSAPTTTTVLRYVYFPGTQSGYKFDYSPYFGMIYKIHQLRGMTVSSSSPTVIGSVSSDGEEAALTHYNYPATSSDLGLPLNDVPAYTWRKDDWQGRTLSAVPQTSFYTTIQVDTGGAGSRTTTITNPDGTMDISVSKITANQNAWDNGLVTEKRTSTVQLSQETIWSRTRMYWETPGPRLDKIELTNDAGQIKAVSFDYDSYNNQTIVKEHDFAAEGQLGTELRRTETTYEDGTGWINNRLVSLPKTIKTIAGGATVSKAVFEYDNYQASPLANTPGVMQHSPSHNPYSTVTECNCRWECIGSFAGSNPESAPHCPNGSSPEWVCDECTDYKPGTDYRGNVTKVTAFSDATLETDSNAPINSFKYDMTGNVIEAGANCCKVKDWTYDVSNGYAYPISESKGDQGQLTTSSTYDFNTGLAKTVTDENNQTATFTYDTASLRQTRLDKANGAWSTVEYNDSQYPYHLKLTRSLDSSRSVSNWSFIDGAGQNYRTRTQTGGGYLSNDTEFDSMGRALKGFNPYVVTSLTTARPSGTKFVQVTQSDGLGRTLQTTLQDNTTVQAEFSGLTATSTDQAGKKRRQIQDTLGRLIRSDEPDSGNSLGTVSSPAQPTYYQYDGNDNLTKVTQTAGGTTQERLFKYDSLSRLRYEKQVEANATLNDSGTKVTSGGLWTGVYNYNTYGLLTEGIDARGVKTTLTYDGLNRTSTISYTGETGYQTPQITYTYDEAHSNYYNKGHPTKVRTAAVSAGGQSTPETIHYYDYDKVGQVVKHNQSIGNQSYVLEYGYNLAGQLTSEKYPSGKTVNFTIDNYGRLTGAADSQKTYLSSISFNSQGLLSQVNIGNGTAETYSYNDRLQMASQSLAKGSDVLQKYEYSFGQVTLADGTVDATKNNGQLGKIEGYIGSTKQWSQRFSYDELGRLSEAREYKSGDNSHLSYKQKFDFDRFGNLYRKAANNPTAGQENPLVYTAIEDSGISKSTNRFTANTTYDDAGQVTSDTKFRNMGFAYDGNGRQIKATKTSVSDALTVYDALGNRVATKIYDTWKYMIYDAFGKLVAEYGIESDSFGGVKYIQQDLQGSVRAVANSSGFVISRTDHQAFGDEIGLGVGSRSIEQGYSADPLTKQGYGLTESDQASGQRHAWWRKLETQGGRWTGADPYKGSMKLNDPQSFNRYSYVHNDPVNFIDPSGLDDCVFFIDTQGNPKFSCWVTSNPAAGSSHNSSGGGSGGVPGPRYVPYVDGGTGPDRGVRTPNAVRVTVTGDIDRQRVYDNVYKMCMARRIAGRASARGNAMLVTIGTGCAGGALTGAFAGATGGGIVGFVFGGGVGSVPVGAAGAITGGILGCGLGIATGAIGQLTVGEVVRNNMGGNDDEECKKEATNANK